MSICVYQAYYLEEQLKQLDPAFIPFDNTKNETPHLREYPMWKKLYEKHAGSEDYWGLMSWRWHEKTGIAGYQFTSWIENNPGYDCYHFDPFKHLSGQHKNLWVQGDIWHPGMLKFANLLFKKLKITERAEDLQYQPEHFGTCNYYVGNSKYWTSLLSFIDECIAFANQSNDMYNYLYVDGKSYNGRVIPYFSFVTERLFSLHNYLKPEYKVKRYD